MQHAYLMLPAPDPRRELTTDEPTERAENQTVVFLLGGPDEASDSDNRRVIVIDMA